jgi:hypothetical protein
MLDATIVDRSQGVRDGMVWIPGGTFRMGSDRHYPEEAPVHRVTVDGFWMDRTPVTNREFRAFVEATGYVTFAEIAPDPKDYPGALPHMLKVGSLNRYLINSPILPAMKTNADGSLTLYIQSKTPGADKEANDPLARVQAMLIILTLYLVLVWLVIFRLRALIRVTGPSHPQIFGVLQCRICIAKDDFFVQESQDSSDH